MPKAIKRDSKGRWAGSIQRPLRGCTAAWWPSGGGITKVRFSRGLAWLCAHLTRWQVLGTTPETPRESDLFFCVERPGLL